MADPVLEAMDRFRGPLDELGRRAQRSLLAEYRSGWTAISSELERLSARVASAPRIPILSGGRTIQGVPPSWTFQQERYIALQSEVRDLIGGMEQRLGAVTRAGQIDGWRLGGDEARAAGRSLAEIPIGSWASVPSDAFQAFVGGARSGPLAPLLQSFAATNGPQAANYARNVLGGGLLRGRSAFAIADDLQAGLSSISYSRALRIARTETLRAYREGVRSNYRANSSIVASWAWRAAVENTERPPCAACFAKHGSLHPIDEPMSTHPNCRCRMVPRRSPVLGIAPNNPVLPDAKGAFDALSPAQQRRILGPTRLEMYRSGRVTLPDFATSRGRGPWGRNDATVRPLSELRSLSSQGRALPTAAQRLFEQSARGEAEISAALQRIGHETGGSLEGFGFRLKRPDRIADKIATDVADGKGGIVGVSESINDALRYTYKLTERRYAAGTNEILAAMQREGMTIVNTKNFWMAEGGGYRGFHAIMRGRDGTRFEMQFHTAQTLARKEPSHLLYEAQRRLGTSAAEKARLQGQIDELWADVRRPRGVESIRQEWPALEAAAPAEIIPAAVETAQTTRVLTVLERRSGFHTQIDDIADEFRTVFAERDRLAKLDIEAPELPVLNVRLIDLGHRATALRVEVRTMLQAEEATLSAQFAKLELAEARTLSAQLREELLRVNADPRRYSTPRAVTGSFTEGVEILGTHASILQDYTALLYRLEQAAKANLPVRERILAFDRVAAPSWKGATRRAYAHAHERMTAIVEAIEAEFPGLRSRWTGKLEGSRNGGHMGFDGTLGLNPNYRLDIQSLTQAARVIETRKLREAGFDVTDPFWQQSIERAVADTLERRGAGQVKVMLHEGLHSVSPGLADEYRALAGWEEGVVEGLTKAIEARIRERLGLGPQQSYSTYAHYTTPLEAARTAIGDIQSLTQSAAAMEPAAFYERLIRAPLPDRPRIVAELLDEAIARNPLRRQELIDLAATLRRQLAGKVRTR